MSADYSQIELRVLAQMADIGRSKEAFAKDIDIHAVTASQMFGKPVARGRRGPAPQRQDDQLRHHLRHQPVRAGPAPGHPAGAGQGLHRILLRAISWHPRLHGAGQGRGAREGLGADAVRPALLHPRDQHQGHGAARLRRAAGDQRADPGLGRRHHEAGDDPGGAGARPANGPGRGMLLQVHDELVFEVPEGEVEATASLVKRTMEGAALLDVPLVVDVGHGTSWDAAH